jgi:hypothetical protein
MLPRIVLGIHFEVKRMSLLPRPVHNCDPKPSLPSKRSRRPGDAVVHVDDEFSVAIGKHNTAFRSPFALGLTDPTGGKTTKIESFVVFR